MNSNRKWFSRLLVVVLGVMAVSPALSAQPAFPVDFRNRFAAVVFDDARNLVVIDDARGKAVSRVRSDRANLLLLSVEAQRYKPFVLHPEVAVEAFLESA